MVFLDGQLEADRRVFRSVKCVRTAQSERREEGTTEG